METVREAPPEWLRWPPGAACEMHNREAVARMAAAALGNSVMIDLIFLC